MASDVDCELIGILNNLSLRTDARSKGWEYVLGLTATDDGLNHIIQSNNYIPFIIKHIQRDKIENEVASLAYKCLINISNHEGGATELLKNKADLCEYLFYSICDEKSHFIQFKCYILSNLSAHPELVKLITDFLVSSEDLLPKLMKSYCSNISEVRNQYDFLTLVFANISRLTSGRRLFLQDTNFMTSILTFTNTAEPDVRRMGVALILRNCCLETDYHERLLNDLIIFPALLLPLMDSKEYNEDEMDKLPIECQCLEETKERDKNASVRRILVQTLFALCYSEKGWTYMKYNGAYFVLRELHLWEADESVKKSIEDLVAYLLVKNYSEPEKGENYFGEDSTLIQQLERDIVTDLPDFVI